MGRARGHLAPVATDRFADVLGSTRGRSDHAHAVTIADEADALISQMHFDGDPEPLWQAMRVLARTGANPALLSRLATEATDDLLEDLWHPVDVLATSVERAAWHVGPRQTPWLARQKARRNRPMLHVVDMRPGNHHPGTQRALCRAAVADTHREPVGGWRAPSSLRGRPQRCDACAQALADTGLADLLTIDKPFVKPADLLTPALKEHALSTIIADPDADRATRSCRERARDLALERMAERIAEDPLSVIAIHADADVSHRLSQHDLTSVHAACQNLPWHDMLREAFPAPEHEYRLADDGDLSAQVRKAARAIKPA